MMSYYLFLSVFLFATGLAVAITKKNVILVLVGIEMMLAAASLNFVVFSRNDPGAAGQFFALFIIALAAAQVVIGLALAIKIYEHFNTSELDRIDKLKN